MYFIIEVLVVLFLKIAPNLLNLTEEYYAYNKNDNHGNRKT